MAAQAVPTKGNLIATKKSLELARVGYELLDRKRNILIREMMMQMCIRDRYGLCQRACCTGGAKGFAGTFAAAAALFPLCASSAFFGASVCRHGGLSFPVRNGSCQSDHDY